MFNVKNLKEVLEADKLEAENKFKLLKPSFEYLKLLEEKKIELELVRWTIGNNLTLDKKISDVHQFKRTSLAKIIIYGLMITLFLLLILITTLYILDDRVFDEYELTKNFKDLDIIGSTPDFE